MENTTAWFKKIKAKVWEGKCCNRTLLLQSAVSVCVCVCVCVCARARCLHHKWSKPSVLCACMRVWHNTNNSWYPGQVDSGSPSSTNLYAPALTCTRYVCTHRYTHLTCTTSLCAVELSSNSLSEQHAHTHGHTHTHTHIHTHTHTLSRLVV